MGGGVIESVAAAAKVVFANEAVQAAALAAVKKVYGKIFSKSDAHSSEPPESALAEAVAPLATREELASAFALLEIQIINGQRQLAKVIIGAAIAVVGSVALVVSVTVLFMR